MIASSIGRVRAGLRAHGDSPPFHLHRLASAMAVGLTPAGAQMKRRDPRPPLIGASSGQNGRAALEAHWAAAEPEDMGAFFTEADIAALDGSWSWLAGVVGQAMQQGSEGLLEDILAAVQPWGFRPHAIGVPVLIMHGAKDKIVPYANGRWLAARCPAAQSRIVRDAGHITMLDSAPEALTWLGARVRG